MDKFSELKAAAMAATPGPWISGDDSWSDGDNANISTEERYDSGIINIAQVEGGGSESGFDEPFSTEQQANAAFIAAANPAAVLELLAELEANKQYAKERDAENEGLALTVGRLRVELEAKNERIDELEASETQLIQERDSAEQALADMYDAATGERPEWSNWFGFADAIEEVAQVRAKLATPMVINLPERRDNSYDWDGAPPSEAFNTCRSICGLMFRQQLRAAGLAVGDE